MFDRGIALLLFLFVSRTLFLIFGDIGSQPCQLNLNSDKGNSFCLGIVMTHQKSCVHYEGPA